jgi:copper(I)-binding protein
LAHVLEGFVMIRHFSIALVTTLSLCAGLAQAQTVEVSDAYARATVTGQKASGAFMTLRSAAATQLVGASSPVAGSVQVHEMKMDGDVMKMRETSALDLPAGQPVELKPGGYHIMLMDLKGPLQADQKIAMTLTFKNAAGQTSKQQLQVPVRAMGGSGASGMGHDHSGMKH